MPVVGNKRGKTILVGKIYVKKFHGGLLCPKKIPKSFFPKKQDIPTLKSVNKSTLLNKNLSVEIK